MISKGLPRALKDLARQAARDEAFPASTSIYSVNRVNAHIMGRRNQGRDFIGSNQWNRRLVRLEKKPTMNDLHNENIKAYRRARVDRELSLMLGSRK